MAASTEITYTAVIAVIRKLQTKHARQREAVAATETELALWQEKEQQLRGSAAKPAK